MEKGVLTRSFTLGMSSLWLLHEMQLKNSWGAASGAAGPRGDFWQGSAHKEGVWGGVCVLNPKYSRKWSGRNWRGQTCSFAPGLSCVASPFPARRKAVRLRGTSHLLSLSYPQPSLQTNEGAVSPKLTPPDCSVKSPTSAMCSAVG